MIGKKVIKDRIDSFVSNYVFKLMIIYNINQFTTIYNFV